MSHSDRSAELLAMTTPGKTAGDIGRVGGTTQKGEQCR